MLSKQRMSSQHTSPHLNSAIPAWSCCPLAANGSDAVGENDQLWQGVKELVLQVHPLPPNLAAAKLLL